MIALSDPKDAVPTYAREGATADELRATEWLLTDGMGGFAMGTALGMPTRRYHGMLVAAMSPPVQREVMLQGVVDTVIVGAGTAEERREDLTPLCFRGGVWAPRAPESLVRFEKGLSCRWVFRIGGVEVVKELRRVRERHACALTYRVRGGGADVELALRPLVAMRDAHGLLHSADPDGPRIGAAGDRGVMVSRGSRRLHVVADSAGFRADPQWWYGFEYEHERDRGMDYLEDLFSPGVFTFRARAGVEAVVTIEAWVGARPEPGWEDEAGRARRVRRAAIAGGDGGAVGALVFAADDFVVRRDAGGTGGQAAGGTGNGGAGGHSIIAGYPWFTDWGRDAMISLPGLLLCTGRHAEARGVLATLGRHRRRGLIPNNFSDLSGEAHYNTVDASLWYLHAACEYLRASGDRAGFMDEIRPACMEIVEAYSEGTDYGIRVDGDGLVMAGDEGTQLTWMDAKRDGVVFTPRHGKPVEISALWHHGLVSLAGALEGAESARALRLREMAARCAAGFRGAFWNAESQCLYDVIQPRGAGSRGWVASGQVRPNQVFAVSLEHSPLEEREQRAVVQCVRSRLLTPCGLRTLDPTDPGYIPRFAGPMFQRDAAYHNGTVWPWLMGPYAEAVLRVGKFSPASRADARALLRPLVARLNGEALGQIPEVFDGDDIPGAPQRPGGCIAQAWSVAEVLRVMVMAGGVTAG